MDDRTITRCVPYGDHTMRVYFKDSKKKKLGCFIGKTFTLGKNLTLSHTSFKNTEQKN